MKKDGPPALRSNGFNENQALFSAGNCAMWIDATSAAGRVSDPKQSKVADKVGFAEAPIAVTPNGSAGPGHGPRYPDLDQEGGSREGLRALGDLEGLCQAGRRDRRLGRSASGHA